MPECVVKNGTTTPTACARPMESVRAVALSQYPSSSTAARTRARVSSTTSGLSLSTRETVAALTPARRATSRIVGPPRPFEDDETGTIASGDYSAERPPVLDKQETS